MLAAAGVAAPVVEAELLLAAVLGRPRTQLRLSPDLSAEQEAAYARLVQRRATREPLQYLLGSAFFRHVELAVGPGVFVPRPETELLVDAVLPHLRGLNQPVIVDLCAGSGALGLAVVDECPAAVVTVVERGPEALRWLHTNVDRLGRGRVSVVAADVLDAALLTDASLLGGLAGRVDAVVANPPYVPAATPVGPEVEHDPPEAVFAGWDGLALMPGLIAVAAGLLQCGGVLAIEHGDTHRAALVAGLDRDSWRDVIDHDDLTGRPRFVTAVRR